MPRPFKNRCVSGQPTSVLYKPAGVPARSLEWITLAMDEFETIRLLDHEGLDQQQAAEKMGVSRPTITRIYASARKKIAAALTLGQGIRIEGGPITETPPAPCGRGMGRRGRHGRGRCGGNRNRNENDTITGE